MTDQPSRSRGSVFAEAVRELRGKVDLMESEYVALLNRSAQIEGTASAVVVATAAIGIDTNQGRVGEALRALKKALDA